VKENAESRQSIDLSCCISYYDYIVYTRCKESGIMYYGMAKKQRSKMGTEHKNKSPNICPAGKKGTHEPVFNQLHIRCDSSECVIM
jgi:hypothetical protein